MLFFAEAWDIIAPSLSGNPPNTRVTYRQNWFRLERFCADHPLVIKVDGRATVPLDPKVLMSYEAWMREPVRQFGRPRYSPQSTAASIAAIKSCYSRLVKLRAIPSDQSPAGVLKCRRRDRNGAIRRRILDSELKAVFEWTESHPESMLVAPFVGLGALAGLRFSEARDLTWEEALGDRKNLRFHGKGGKFREVPRSEALTAYLARLQAYTPASGPYDKVFQGRRLGTARSEAYIRKHWLKGLDAVAKGVDYHSLRHAFAVGLRARGVAIEQISKILGHESIETTMIYLGSFAHDFRAARKQLRNWSNEILSRGDTRSIGHPRRRRRIAWRRHRDSE